MTYREGVKTIQGSWPKARCHWQGRAPGGAHGPLPDAAARRAGLALLEILGTCRGFSLLPRRNDVSCPAGFIDESVSHSPDHVSHQGCMSLPKCWSFPCALEDTPRVLDTTAGPHAPVSFWRCSTGSPWCLRTKWFHGLLGLGSQGSLNPRHSSLHSWTG